MINPALLVMTKDLQQFLIGKDGLPLAAGIVTCYSNTNRTVLKNWYYMPFLPGSSVAIPLPNPLTLSAAGTIVDDNGYDVLPMYYPVSESDNLTPEVYYITVDNSDGQRQFTRQNFPYIPANSVSFGTSIENYIINNVFWRYLQKVNNVGILTQSQTVNISGNVTWYYATLAPSQHDGFSFPDFCYVKDGNSSSVTNEVATFNSFQNVANTLLSQGDIPPEYYLNHNCTSVMSASDTFRCYQFPISLHIQTLSQVSCTVTFDAQWISGTDFIAVYVFQYAGTGQSSDVPFFVEKVTLNNAWTKYVTKSFSLPDATGVSVGAYDNALYLQLVVPSGGAGVCNINFTKPSLYLSSTVPTNDFQTYDQIDAIINSPRTGDVRTSINQFYPFGWVPMNDGTIGNPSSNATTRQNADTWQLYNLLWTTFKGYTLNGSPLVPMYSSTGSPLSAYGSTAISDFNANNALALTQMMGKVMMGTVPMSSLLSATPTVYGYKSAFTGSATTITLTNNIMNLFNGCPVTFSGTTTLSTSELYYVGNIAISYSPPTQVTTFSVYTTFSNAITNTSAQSVDSSGTINYTIAGGYEGEYSHTQSISELATHSHPPLTGAAFVTTGSGNLSTGGSNSVNDTSTGDAGLSHPFNITQPSTFYNMYIKL